MYNNNNKFIAIFSVHKRDSISIKITIVILDANQLNECLHSQDLLELVNEEYDTDINILKPLELILVNQVLKVSTGSVEDAEEIVDKITNKRKPEYIVSRTRKRRKMGW